MILFVDIRVIKTPKPVLRVEHDRHGAVSNAKVSWQGMGRDS
jgi:hypothetical protein